jgi:CO/xanthine dehydrogenase FAD-binding subunit
MNQQFNFFAPKTIDEALALLASENEIKIIAGGTDVITAIHQGSSRFKSVQSLLDINQIKELQMITEKGKNIVIGGGCTITQTIEHPLVKKFFTVVVPAGSGIGSLQIRNRATLSGNFVNNAPCADSVPALIVYGAELQIRSAKAERKIKLEDFLIKPYRTQLQPDELVIGIHVPKPSPAYKGNFYKLGRRRGVAISRITLAVFAEITNGKINDIRIASGAVTPIGCRIPELEKMLMNQIVSDELAKDAAIELGKIILDKTGLRWSSAYKLPVVQQMCYIQLSGLFGTEAK